MSPEQFPEDTPQPSMLTPFERIHRHGLSPVILGNGAAELTLIGDDGEVYYDC